MATVEELEARLDAANAENENLRNRLALLRTWRERAHVERQHHVFANLIPELHRIAFNLNDAIVKTYADMATYAGAAKTFDEWMLDLVRALTEDRQRLLRDLNKFAEKVTRPAVLLRWPEPDLRPGAINHAEAPRRVRRQRVVWFDFAVGFATGVLLGLAMGFGLQ